MIIRARQTNSCRWVLALLTALVTVAAIVGLAGSASAATTAGAETRLRASIEPAAVLGGVAEYETAGQRLGEAPDRVVSVVATGVAAETGETAAQAAVHGNSASSPARAYLYRLYDSEGNYLKTGISKNPTSRYTKTFMQDKYMEIMQSGSRRQMLNLERFIVERDPGPLNREPGAGAFGGDVP